MTKSPGCISGALAIDRGVGAVPLDDEAQRRLRVAMRRRDLARQDQLQPGEQRAGDRGLAARAPGSSASARGASPPAR